MGFSLAGNWTPAALDVPKCTLTTGRQGESRGLERGHLVRAQATQDCQLLEGAEAAAPGLRQGHLMGLVAVKDGLKCLRLLGKVACKALHGHTENPTGHLLHFPVYICPVCSVLWHGAQTTVASVRPTMRQEGSATDCMVVTFPRPGIVPCLATPSCNGMVHAKYTHMRKLSTDAYLSLCSTLVLCYVQSKCSMQAAAPET